MVESARPSSPANPSVLALAHGGRLRQAAADYAIPLADWLDLSTGINPQGWPVALNAAALPPEVWQRLPEDNDGLEAAAAAYYGVAPENLLPVAGSQAAIQMLPQLFSNAQVVCLGPLYAEHPAAWEAAGHNVSHFSTGALEAASNMTEVVVLCNPNNPTATLLPRERLLKAIARLGIRNSWMLVDEAFADALPPEHSLAPLAGSETAPNLIVFRSLGKFFGLAGIRVGFVCATPAIIALLRQRLGPWALSGPARAVARQALADTAWQTATRTRLHQDSTRLAQLLSPLGEISHTPLFCYLPLAAQPGAATRLADFFAQHGILIRRFDTPEALRFGLPGDETGWQRLTTAVKDWLAANPT